jgi:hypothetical protein
MNKLIDKNILDTLITQLINEFAVDRILILAQRSV